MNSIKVCEYSRSRSFHDDLILQDQASGERSQDQWSSGYFFSFQTEKTEKPKRQARTDTSKNKIAAGSKPPAKKQKLDSEDSFTENSIFNHL